MFTTESTLKAEIDYRANRLREDWAPRRRRSVRRGKGRHASTTGR